MSTAKGTGITPLKAPHRIGRAALLVLGMSSLVTGIWGGLLRVPLPLPLPVEHANWISFHGPLMVCGFLGTLISLERAVGLRALWTYLVPLRRSVTGVSYLSQDSRVLHWELGAAARVKRLEVHWHAGESSRVENLEASTQWIWMEDESAPRPFAAKAPSATLTTVAPAPTSTLREPTAIGSSSSGSYTGQR